MHLHLYERSAIWRGIVQATRNPKFLSAFVVLCFGGSVAAGKVAMYMTSGSSEETRELMEEKVRTDPEAAKYASFSKKAVNEIIRQAKGDTSKPPETNEMGQRIMLPQTAWHPEAEDNESNGGKSQKPTLKKMW